jgi:KTSC domain
MQGRDDRLPADGRIYSRGAAAWPLKRATVVRSLVVFCISIAVVGVASAEPSATPSQIISHIPRQPVQSSAIAKIGYSKRRHILEIEFVNGAVYRYLDVPVVVYRGLMSAESKARFYDSNIRGHYRSVVVRS